MGENLVLNLESRGFRVSVFNRTTAVTEKFASGRAKGQEYRSDQDARRIRAIARAPPKGPNHGQGGRPVDAVIDQLVPLLEPEDIIIDGGELTLERYAAA